MVHRQGHQGRKGVTETIEAVMKQQIHDAILAILEEKKREGEVLPFATSIEVSHRLKMNALDVEKIAEDIEGIVKGKTKNEEYYYE